MSKQDRLKTTTVKPNYSSQSEIDSALSIFDSFRKEAKDTKSSLGNKETSPQQPVLTLSSIGQLGRFGNQIFQYACLRICAEQSGAKIDCPPWIGQNLKAHNDASNSQRLTPAQDYKND